MHCPIEMALNAEWRCCAAHNIDDDYARRSGGESVCDRLHGSVSQFGGTPMPTSTTSESIPNFCHANENEEHTRFHNSYEPQKQTEFYAYLLVLFLFAILLQASHAIPVTKSGQRLILHTNQYRQRYHTQVLQQQRTQVTPSTHRHHLHLRSVVETNTNANTNKNTNANTNANNINKNANNMADMQPEQFFGASKKNSNNGGDERDNGEQYCRCVVAALNYTRRQTDNTFSFIHSQLADYTKNQFNKNVTEVNRNWELHKLNLSHPYVDHLKNSNDFNVVPGIDHYAHLNNADLTIKLIIEAELIKVYKTLWMLNETFESLIKNRSENSNKILHDLHNDHVRYKEIEKFLRDAHRHVGSNMEETKDAMGKLNIQEPTMQAGKPEIEYNHSLPLEVVGWLVIKEHLLVIQYLRGLYAVLLSKCSMAGA